MILTKVSVFKVFYVTVALLCLMADKTKGGIVEETVSTSTEDAMMMSQSVGKNGIEGVENVATKPSQTTETSDDAIGSLSFWGIVRTFLHWIRDDLSESFLSADDVTASSNMSIVGNGNAAAGPSSPAAEIEGRTFGKIRRLQMAMIPIIFKFGVLSAMVAFLVILGMKTLFLLKVLIFMNAAVILGKFLTLKHQNHEHIEHGPWTYNNWNPHVPGHGLQQHSAQNKEIHLHIHGNGGANPQVSSYPASSPSHTNSWDRRHDPYNSYEPTSIGGNDFDNDLNNQGPISAQPTKYPSNY